ncbi:MAG TPA: IS200/IS605 family transposase [Ktedonobacterales bacterium]
MRQSGSAVYVHFVWATWDRLPLLSQEVERAAYRGIGAKCTELGAEVIALGGIEDHVHLLVHMPSTTSIAQFVGQVKGASAHLITHEVLAN